MEKKKIVFLYSELAAYFLACIEELLKRPGIEVHIIRWPVNKEAPFRFSFPENVKIYSRNEFDSAEALARKVDAIGPSAIYCSGWVDKGYLSVCKAYKNKIPVIVGFDNQWKGTLKQRIATFISPFKILNHFSHCWVPGAPQEEYAVRLGFKKDKVLTGFYCCDHDFFHQQYLANADEKKEKFPKRFIYIGRYYDFKGITDLWEAFIELQEEQPNDWELWCLGTGDIAPVEHPKIMHFGFVQPAELPKFIKGAGVFVLPSHFEPWGVVVHEFAAAGFPLICSDEVGACSAFVQNDFNGYIYHAGNKKALKETLRKMMGLEQEQLITMAERSVEKAKLITPATWTKQLISLLG